MNKPKLKRGNVRFVNSKGEMIPVKFIEPEGRKMKFVDRQGGWYVVSMSDNYTLFEVESLGYDVDKEHPWVSEIVDTHSFSLVAFRDRR